MSITLASYFKAIGCVTSGTRATALYIAYVITVALTSDTLLYYRPIIYVFLLNETNRMCWTLLNRFDRHTHTHTHTQTNKHADS